MRLDELSIDPPLYTQNDGADSDPQTPFFASVKQSPFSRRPTPHLTEFRYYCQLPPELQLMVLEQCDRPTLFSLMQTCSRVRECAQSLFWSDPSTWYYYWCGISRDPTARPFNVGPPLVCADFAAKVQQLEVDFSWLWVMSWKAEDHERFWNVVLGLFPRVKRVVLADTNFPYTVGIPFFPERYAPLIHAAPSQVSVLVSKLVALYNNSTSESGEYLCNIHERNLCHLDKNSQFAILKRPWKRHRVVVPAVKVSGFIGLFFEIQMREKLPRFMLYALRIIRREVIEAYHFGGGRHIPFDCPSPGCKTRFYQAGESTKHTPSHDDWESYEQGSPSFPSPLPSDIEDQLWELRGAIVEAKRLYFRSLVWGEKVKGEVNSHTRRLYVERIHAQLQLELRRIDVNDYQQQDYWRRLCEYLESGEEHVDD